MVFLATGIHDATVAINGARATAPTTDKMNKELSKAVDKYAPPLRFSNNSSEGSTATFKLAFQQGENVMTFTYAQSTRFDENNMRYGAPKHDQSKMTLTS